MCGIAGVVERGVRSAALLEEIARKMAVPLAHRGPDADGVWTDADAGVGHRRLSIIDLSPAGAQPMVSASGRLAISCNGEIYNAAELRAELEARCAFVEDFDRCFNAITLTLSFVLQFLSWKGCEPFRNRRIGCAS